MKTNPEESQKPVVETPDLNHPVEDRPASQPLDTKVEPAKPKKNSLLTRIMRWFLLLLIFFGLGALLVIFFLYLPLRESTEASRTSLQSELQTSQERVAELETQESILQSLEKRNQELEAELLQANQRILLLSAQADIASARLALAQEDPGVARTLLNGVKKNLDNLAEIANQDQKEAVSTMQQRLQLAIGGLEDDSYAAQSDLDVLATNLLQYENSLLSEP